MFEIMEQFQEYMVLAMKHLAAYQLYYGAGVIVVAPIIYFTRKWSIPLFLYLLEIVIYLCLMHGLIHVMTFLMAAFKNATSMKYALRPDGQPLDAVDWTTPLINFWDLEKYNPNSIVYVEGVLACIAIVLVFKFRPLKTQKPKPRFKADGSRINEEKDGTDVTAKYGKRRYAEDWAKEAARTAKAPRIGDQPGNKK